MLTSTAETCACPMCIHLSAKMTPLRFLTQNVMRRVTHGHGACNLPRLQTIICGQTAQFSHFPYPNLNYRCIELQCRDLKNSFGNLPSHCPLTSTAMEVS